jgi:serine/threonine protein kinase
VIALPGLVLGARLGKGAFGTVYAAEHEVFGEIAVKVLPEGTRAEPLRAKFDAVAALRHPNLLRLLALEEDEGHAYVVMERLDGVDLLTWVRPKRAPIDPTKVRATIPLAFGTPVQEGLISAFFPIDRVGLQRLVPAMSALASALAALHGAGRIHRDVRPENVVVTRDERVVLIDYGLLVEVDREREDDEVAGAPAYMAPDDAPSFASDWYSFGVLLFEALTGALPFSGTGQEVIVRKRTVAAPSPSFVVELPDEARALDALCVRLLRRAASMRPSEEEILSALSD